MPAQLPRCKGICIAGPALGCSLRLKVKCHHRLWMSHIYELYVGQSHRGASNNGLGQLRSAAWAWVSEQKEGNRPIKGQPKQCTYIVATFQATVGKAKL